MTDMPAEFRSDPTDSDARINGVIDVPRTGRVAGWAIDRSDENATVIVTVFREGRVVGEVRADAHRPDLERGGIGTGCYGFTLDIDPPVEPGFEFTITATARADDGTSGDLRQIGRARPAEDSARRLAERTFTDLTALRVAVAQLATRQNRTAELRLSEALDRVEVVQARLEETLASAPTSAPQSRGSGIALAIGLALIIGTGSLALGIWSMIAG